MPDQPHNILLLTAMQAEMLPILQSLNLSKRNISKTNQINEHFQVTPCVIGMGSKYAANNANKLIERHAPDLILLFGISGSLDPELESGDLLIPDSYITDNNDPVMLPLSLNDDLIANNLTELDALREAIEITSSKLVSTPEHKLHLYEHKLGHAVDMESYHVARAARSYSIPFLSIRAISDTSEDHLMPEAANWINPQFGTQKNISATLHLLLHPTCLPDLLYMRQTFNTATQSLAQAANHLLLADSRID